MMGDIFYKERDSLYRKNVGIVLINNQQKVFAGKRFGNSKYVSWQMPQGGIAPEEEEEDAIIREINEEIGLMPNSYKICAKTQKHYYYIIPEKMRKTVWNNIYVGQKQRWFLANFTGMDSDINIETDFPEFVTWGWLDVEEIMEGAVSFKKDVYYNVFQEFNLL